ncbi:MAG: hypothetical protein IPH84_16045 [Bacteroidales bacterium]|nr:hypothetical protein [Bacteroidales bacterium]
MKGYSYWGDLYSFGVGGFNYNDLTRCGGILGAYAYATTSSYWGSLGYKNSGSSTYGGYFTSSTSGAGKSSQANAAIGIGIGAGRPDRSRYPWEKYMGCMLKEKTIQSIPMAPFSRTTWISICKTMVLKLIPCYIQMYQQMPPFKLLV